MRERTVAASGYKGRHDGNAAPVHMVIGLDIPECRARSQVAEMVLDVLDRNVLLEQFARDESSAHVGRHAESQTLGDLFAYFAQSVIRPFSASLAR